MKSKFFLISMVSLFLIIYSLNYCIARSSNTQIVELNAKTFPSLSAAVADVGHIPVIMRITDVQSVKNNLYIPPNISVRIEKGGKLSIAPGKKLTIRGKFDAGRYRVFNGAGTIVFEGKSLITVYPDWWGGMADGITDVGAPLRAACKSIALNGGVISLGPGVYVGKTWDKMPLSQDEYVMAIIPGNVSIVGTGNTTVLKPDVTVQSRLREQAGGRWSFFGSNSGKGQKVSKIKFDFTGVLVPDGGLYSFNAARFNVPGEISDCWIENPPGANAIVTTHSSKVLRNTIHNGGKNIPGNELAADYSAIYVNGAGSGSNGSYTADDDFTVVEGNTVYLDDYPVWYAGGLEMHNSKIKAINNYFKHMLPGIYLASDYRGVTAKDKYVGNNFFDECHTGLMVSGENNVAEIKFNKFNTNYSHAAISAGVTTPAAAILTPRNDNTWLDSPGFSNSIITSNTFTSSGKTASTAIRIGSSSNIVISHNVFEGIVSGISIIGTASGSKNILIEGNRFENPVESPFAYDLALVSIDTTSAPPGVAPAISNITVSKNYFSKRGHELRKVAAFGKMGKGIDVVFSGNTLVNIKPSASWSSKITMKP